MSNIFHKDFIELDMHVPHAKEYADIAARDADTEFQVIENLNKFVLVLSPINIYSLVSIGPASWLAVSNGGGSITGPVGAIDEEISIFDGTTGTAIKGGHGVTIDTDGLISTPGDILSDNHFVSKRGALTVEVFSEADLPPAVSGVITLVASHYIFKEAFTISNRLFIGNIDCRIEMGETLTYDGTETLLTVTDGKRIVIDPVDLEMTGAGSTMFDIDGNSFIIRDGNTVFNGTNQTIGNFSNLPALGVRNVFISGYSQGFSLENVSRIVFERLVVISNLLGTGAFIHTEDSPDTLGDVDFITIVIGPSEAVFNLSPFALGPINIRNTVKESAAGEFFAIGVTGSITGFVDNSVGATPVIVADNAGESQFQAIAHGLVVGETVTHTLFTNAGYNGDYVVTAATVNTYEVGLAFIAADSGFFSTTTVQVNSIAHGLTLSTAVSIFDTVYFSGGFKIFNVQANSFEISFRATFPPTGTETGTWDTSSLDETSKFVNAQQNGEQKDSQTIGDTLVGGNLVATIIAVINVFVDFDLNDSAVASSSMELFTLVDTNIASLRYDGLNPKSMTVSGIVAASSTGGGQRFDFQLCRNGVGLDPPDNVDIPLEIGSNLNAAPLDWAIVVDPGDILHLQVKNTEGTSNITIDTLKFAVR
tara:strand:+ start:24329 stop:26275 length:1947 start_codon:yes stop_codon:yes gene_type:complete